MKKTISFICCMAFSAPLFSMDFEWMPERRKNQFPNESAHLFVPLPYSYPGVGEGFFLIANMSNLAETTADLAIIGIVGDATGTVIQSDEISLIDQQLLMHVQLQNINRAVVNNYDIRGMNDASDYNLLDITQADENVIQLKHTSMDRRLNFFVSYRDANFALDAIRESDGAIIQQLTES